MIFCICMFVAMLCGFAVEAGKYYYAIITAFMALYFCIVAAIRDARLDK